MTLEKEAGIFIEQLQRAYLEERDMEAVLAALDEKVSWIGTGEKEICNNLGEAAVLLLAEKRECPRGFRLMNTEYNVYPLTEELCAVYGTMTAVSDDSRIADIYDRFSAVCKRTEKGMRLAHIHLSKANVDQSAEEFYAKTSAVENRIHLEERAKETVEALELREEELAALTENIPAGMYKCLDDPYLTIMSMNSSFLSLFGYTRAEVREIFRDRYIEMIYKEDREPVRKELQRQQTEKRELELEYRILKKDGQIRWVIERGNHTVCRDGTRIYYGVMLDMTESIKQREELRLSLERHQVIMDQTTDIIFEWNIIEDTLTYSPNWIKKFGYAPLERNISRRIPKTSNIHPDDIESFMKIMKDTAAGVPYSETEFRIRNILGHYAWCLIRATAQYKDGVPVRAVGVIIDIDEDKKQKQSLIRLAEIDSLTGLLNKAAVHNKVEHLLKDPDCPQGILMLIDLDDFKRINDRYGHLQGDMVLTEVSQALKNRLRSTDIVGRIGGDEFIVFLPGVTKKGGCKIAGELLEEFLEINVMDKKGAVLCSIGSAGYPEDGEEFYHLYQRADQALYHVKNTGKYGYAEYHGHMESQIPEKM
jgi:diguanylate cyclase (GGDEF)-like protein/PAS domain S-box-containing protein